MSVAGVGFSVPQTHTPVEFHGTVKPESKTAERAAPKTHPIETATLDLQRIGRDAFNKKLQFVVDHQSDQVIVKVIDKETDKVIRELPPEELQRLHQNLKEAIGLLFDELV